MIIFFISRSKEGLVLSSMRVLSTIRGQVIHIARVLLIPAARAVLEYLKVVDSAEINNLESSSRI